jgi:hypothetical protein
VRRREALFETVQAAALADVRAARDRMGSVGKTGVARGDDP